MQGTHSALISAGDESGNLFTILPSAQTQGHSGCRSVTAKTHDGQGSWGPTAGNQNAVLLQHLLRGDLFVLNQGCLPGFFAPRWAKSRLFATFPVAKWCRGDKDQIRVTVLILFIELANHRYYLV